MANPPDRPVLELSGSELANWAGQPISPKISPYVSSHLIIYTPFVVIVVLMINIHLLLSIPIYPVTHGPKPPNTPFEARLIDQLRPVPRDLCSSLNVSTAKAGRVHHHEVGQSCSSESWLSVSGWAMQPYNLMWHCRG